MNKEDVNTFSITFKTTNEGYSYIDSFINAHCEVIKSSVIADTEKAYKEDKHFKKLVDNCRKANKDRLDYINKYL